METSESKVVAATEAKPIKVYVPMISDLITDKVTHHYLRGSRLEAKLGRGYVAGARITHRV